MLKKSTELDLHLDNLDTLMRCSNATLMKLQGIWFQCCFCSSRYEHAAALKTHTLENHEDGKEFAGRSVAELILRVDITGLQCKLCESDVNDLDQIMEHLRKDHSEKIHTHIKNYMIPFKFDTKEPRCAICDMEFHNFKTLQLHMNSHFGNFICKECGSGFVNQRSLNVHVSRHANGLFKCETCQRIFDNNLKLKEHEKAVHRGMNKRHKCDFCDQRFIGVIAKSAHMVKEHGLPVPEAKCPACDKTFKNHKYLTTHKRTYHMMEKRHKCPECEKMFYSTHEVKQHMLTHSGQRDFKCVICSKAYGRKSTLREHMRIHADDRRFKCEHCGMAFVQKCSWRAHMRSKHGEEV